MKIAHEKISRIMLESVAMAMASGLDFNEARAMFRAAASLMDQVASTPNMDDDKLCEMALQQIRTELSSQEVKQS